MITGLCYVTGETSRLCDTIGLVRTGRTLNDITGVSVSDRFNDHPDALMNIVGGANEVK